MHPLRLRFDLWNFLRTQSAAQQAQALATLNQFFHPNPPYTTVLDAVTRLSPSDLQAVADVTGVAPCGCGKR